MVNGAQEEGRLTIALLIDSDNVSGKYIKTLIGELQALGRITVKRIYGDFTKPENNGWKKEINEYGISPIQQFAFTTGKNATDSTMIIDAMDLLYSNSVDTFCLATSDSDFTRLAVRLKESNVTVLGAGEQKTPQSFVNTCDRFFMLDTLYASAKEQKAKKTPVATPKKGEHAEPVARRKDDEVYVPDRADIFEDVREFISELSDDSDWVMFSRVMDQLYKKYPQFNYKLYGARNLKDFFKGSFEFKKQDVTVELIRIVAQKKPNIGKKTV